MERLKIFENGCELWLAIYDEYSEIVFRFSENEWEFVNDETSILSDKHCETLESKRAEALARMPKRVEFECINDYNKGYEHCFVTLKAYNNLQIFMKYSRVKVIIEEVVE